MLTYGGLGLLVAGLVMSVTAEKIVKDPAKAAKAKKQGPLMALIGAAALGLGIYLGSVLG